MSWIDFLIPCLAAVAGGAVNSVAGGGTLLTFPALFSVLGSMPGAGVIANATSTVALVPGSAAAVWGYRHELANVAGWNRLLILPSFVGGLLGSLLVAELNPATFETLVPWLILAAALLFALQPLISRQLGIGRHSRPPSGHSVAMIMVFQFMISIYGGYFGAGIGILMLSGLAFMGLSDIHAMNALKTLLNCIINGVSVVVFVQAGIVNWPLAITMALAAMVGGYAGARIARRLNRDFVRGMVVAIGLALAAYYFYQQFSPRSLTANSHGITGSATSTVAVPREGIRPAATSCREAPGQPGLLPTPGRT